ncbi:MAG: hypothetical protein ABI920_12430, partial [Casimicrobiaceae bacterium]
QPVDPPVEEAFYYSLPLRFFVGIDLGRKPGAGQDEAMRFRHLLESIALESRKFNGQLEGGT